jgi:glycosyltransferase involved in cell wall biosynthesis
VSVIIPAYNAAWCIDRALHSVFDQSFRDFELIVVNDGSTDGTAENLNKYGERIRVINQPNNGMCSARNLGIQNAGGEYVAFLDADDYWYQRKLEQQVELLQNNQDIGFCSTRTLLEDMQGNKIGEWNCPEIKISLLHTIFEQNGAVAGGASSVMVRRRLLQESGLFDETLGGVEDPDLWMRLAAITQYACIGEPLTVVIKREGSVSDNLHSMRSAAIRVMNKNRPLLGEDAGAFWRGAQGSVLLDYAKWAYRSGKKGEALRDIMKAMVLAPIKHARLSIGLIIAILAGKEI